MSAELFGGLQPVEIGLVQGFLHGIHRMTVTPANPLNDWDRKLLQCVIAATENREALRHVFPDLDTPDKVTDESWQGCMDARQRALELLNRKE